MSQPLAENIDALRRRIAAAAGSVGGSAERITLVAVSKRHPLSAVKSAHALGLRHFGESQIQEALPKIHAGPEDIAWHFVGHLQRNKVRKAVKDFTYIHGVDSLSLLRRIDAIAAEERVCPKVFLQVNYALDAAKYGLYPEAVAPVLEAALPLEHLACIGLMGIPPQEGGIAVAREYFQGLAALRDQLRGRFPGWSGKLSMGMSADFEEAIRAGADYIRVGTLLFGERD